MSKKDKSWEEEKDEPFNTISYLEEINRWVSGTQCIHKRGNFAALLI